MILFKNLTTDDKELIQQFTLPGARQNCDLSFANIISWQFLYGTHFAVIGDYLVFRFYAGRHLAYMTPIRRPSLRSGGNNVPDEEDDGFASTIRILREDSIAMGHPFLMLGVCMDMVDRIEKAFPGMFRIQPDRDHADYVYDREKLITLAGKKLQGKRNHVNKFRKLYPDYIYKPLTTDMIAECLRLEESWRGQQEPDAQMTAELRSMTRAFNRWDQLGLTGGTIWVDGKIIAFTFGCPINHSTFDVCVEKADTTYEGAFNIINQEFVQHLPEQYVYINREEDLGDEGLRFAKLSYRPDILLEKCVVTEHRPLADFASPEQVLAETRQLWEDTFHDAPAFTDLYFSRVYRHEYNVTCQIGGHVMAALQTLPYTLRCHQDMIRAAYVSGVSVRQEAKRQHIGTNLMRQAHFSMYAKDVVLATLIPAEDWLYDWYGSLGYARRITCVPPPDSIETMDFADFDRWQSSRTCLLLHDEERFDVAKTDIRLAGTDYHPPTEPIDGMIRVINAHKALKAFARRNRSLSCTIRVEGDEDIPMNNAYYRISDGSVTLSDEPDTAALRMTIRQLADYIFKEEKAEMTLMLN